METGKHYRAGALPPLPCASWLVSLYQKHTSTGGGGQNPGLGLGFPWQLSNCGVRGRALGATRVGGLGPEVEAECSETAGQGLGFQGLTFLGQRFRY